MSGGMVPENLFSRKFLSITRKLSKDNPNLWYYCETHNKFNDATPIRPVGSVPSNWFLSRKSLT
jgi:hypothetical protein